MIKCSLASFVTFLLLVCIGAPAETIVFGDGSVTFEAPAGFRALTVAEMARKFPRSADGSRAVGNESLGTTIAYGASVSPLTVDDLPEMQQTFTDMFEEASPGIAWIQNVVVEMDSKPWVYMEFTSEAVDTDIHNIILFTAHQGRVVMFNFNSRTAEFDQYEAALRRSIDSIELRER